MLKGGWIVDKNNEGKFLSSALYDWYCPNEVDNQLCLVILYLSVRFRCGDASNPYFTLFNHSFPIIIQFTNVMQSAMHTPTAMFVGNIILRATVYEVTYINVRYVRLCLGMNCFGLAFLFVCLFVCIELDPV